ncbi:MAG: ccmA [Acidimicrobiaceae bacterium]|nr:ccmA [Acidimicrobiaceae bacterium]
MGPVISLREAVSLSGRFPLLAGVTFEVAEGEVVHLRGPNGAGKSSLLRLCAGLVAVSSGTAVVLGHDLTADRQTVRREVGLLAHSSFLYDDLSVVDNLRFAVRASRSDPAGVDRALALLGLDGRLRGTRVGRLSAGQRRRTAIAVLAARRPRLWLLDEPHAGLDAEGRELLDELVVGARSDGATVVLASHELDRADRLADRVVALAGGRVVAPAPAPAPAPADSVRGCDEARAPVSLAEGCDVA